MYGAIEPFHATRHLVRVAVIQGVRPRVERPSRIVRMQRAFPRPGAVVAQAGAEQLLHPFVAVVDDAVGPCRPHDLRHRIGEAPEPCFALAQRIFGGALLGDVGVRTEPADHVARLAADRDRP